MIRGDRLKTVREARGLTQRELSLRCDIGEKQIWRYENNKSDPSSDHITKIATELNVSSDYLLGLSDRMSTDEEGTLPMDEQLILDYYRNGQTKDLLRLISNDRSEGNKSSDKSVITIAKLMHDK